MSFLFLMLAFSALADGPQYVFGDRKDYRMALRHGMAGGFTFTGIDHFMNAHSRYVPMLPDFLADYALELVYCTGAAELAGAIGLVVPLVAYKRLGLPNLRTWAGIGLATMLAFAGDGQYQCRPQGQQCSGPRIRRLVFLVASFISADPHALGALCFWRHMEQRATASS